MTKTPSFQCRGHGFDPWSGNQDPTGQAVWPKRIEVKADYSKKISFLTEDTI